MPERRGIRISGRRAGALSYLDDRQQRDGLGGRRSGGPLVAAGPAPPCCQGLPAVAPEDDRVAVDQDLDGAHVGGEYPGSSVGSGRGRGTDLRVELR